MASASESELPANSLGLDFDQLKVQDPDLTPVDPPQDAPTEKDKKKPYVNPERVKTGGTQRDKLSEEALSERMARMREQNEKIKQRRLDVQADEDAFKKTQETERAKLAQIRKVQEGVDRTREQNAKRKLDKMQNREWDSGKPVGGGDWKHRPPAKSETQSQTMVTSTKEEMKEGVVSTPNSPSSTHDSGEWTRGAGPRGSPRNRGGRGRARGRGMSTGGPDKNSTTMEADTTPTTPTTNAPKNETKVENQ